MDKVKDYMCIEVESLISIFRFVETVEAVLLKADYPKFTVDIRKEARDNFGKHWRGYRSEIKGKKKGTRLYTHFGLVYLPETRRGIYCELDKRNNLGIYEKVWDNVKESCEYDLNKDEADYLKFFFPDARMEKLMSSPREEQNKMVGEFFASCVKSMLEAAES